MNEADDLTPKPVEMIHMYDLAQALANGLLGPPDPLCRECGQPIVSNLTGTRKSWCHVDVPVGNGHRAYPLTDEEDTL